MVERLFSEDYVQQSENVIIKGLEQVVFKEQAFGCRTDYVAAIIRELGYDIKSPIDNWGDFFIQK